MTHQRLPPADYVQILRRCTRHDVAVRMHEIATAGRCGIFRGTDSHLFSTFQRCDGQLYVCRLAGRNVSGPSTPTTCVVTQHES